MTAVIQSVMWGAVLRGRPSGDLPKVSPHPMRGHDHRASSRDDDDRAAGYSPSTAVRVVAADPRPGADPGHAPSTLVQPAARTCGNGPLGLRASSPHIRD